MIRTFKAQAFIEPAARGGNYPALVRARDDSGDSVDVYIKTRAGYGDRPAAAGVELWTTLLARQLGLLAPEPVVVEVPPEFASQIFGRPFFRDLFARSEGRNFATVALEGDWKTWPVEMSGRAFPEEVIEAILFFDAMTQHTDRASNNPNLLWRGHQIAVLDHEKCFGYLGLARDQDRPWRTCFQHDPLATHCLRSLGRGLVRSTEFGHRMWEGVLELQFDDRLTNLAASTIEVFPNSEVEISRIVGYFDALFRDLDDFVGHLKHALSK